MKDSLLILINLWYRNLHKIKELILAKTSNQNNLIKTLYANEITYNIQVI